MEKLSYTKSKGKEQTGEIFAIQMTKASEFLVYQEEKDQPCRRKKKYFLIQSFALSVNICLTHMRPTQF